MTERQASTVPRERRLVRTPHGYLHVATAGAGDATPLLLLHMSPLSGRMWDAMVQRMARDRLVVVPDRLGFGDSDRLAAPISLAEYARATVLALDELGLERVDVLGIHTGSCEAIELAAVHPGRVRRIAIVAIPALDSEERRAFKATYGDAPVPASAAGEHLTETWSWWREADPDRDWPPDLVHARVLDHLRAGPNVWWTYHAVFDYPTAERLAQVRQPLLVLGPHDDLWEQTRRAIPLLPAQSRFVELPHLGYEVFTLAADEMADVITPFLEEEA